MPQRLLLQGHDTIEGCYYLRTLPDCTLNFEKLAVERETLRQSKSHDPKVITLGGIDFLLHSHGTGRGYPFLITNEQFSIEFGEFNNPSFYVTFRSMALWQKGAAALHQEFMDWAASLGLYPFKPETLSRVDFTFDYFLPEIDFDEDSFVSLSEKDNQYRKNGIVQTFVFGKSDIVLRMYNKVDEIEEQSGKTWFYELWGINHDVWRIEWQIRKDVLRRFSIRTFADLQGGQGDLLRYLAEEHTTLRIKGDDSNRSRWPLHPLWLDLQEQIKTLECQGVYREIDQAAILNERLMRMAIAMYGYLKRIAAVHCIQHGEIMISNTEAQRRLENLIAKVHDPLTWTTDVTKRIDAMRLGQW